jgi:hypothetical protein
MHVLVSLLPIGGAEWATTHASGTTVILRRIISK